MKTVKALTSLLFAAVMAIALSTLFNVNPVAVLAGLILVSFVTSPAGVFQMAITKEIWQADIIKNLFKDNAFAKRAYNSDHLVLGGKVVHSPIAGTPANVKKNLTSFPQTAVNRGDTEQTYPLDTFYSLPRQIQDIETYELSYNKRQSVVGEDQQNLIQTAMEGLLYNWAPAASNVIETSGADSNTDLINGANGSRKIFTKVVFSAIAKKLANGNLANSSKVALLTANHYYQFFESLTDAEKTNFNNVANLAEGSVGRYMGFDVIMRSTVLRYRKNGSNIWIPVDEQADAFAAGAGDSAASLFWVDSCVERAVGDVKVFEDNGNPLYYGDVFSALIRMGGRIRRAAGVYAVAEAITPAA